MAEPGDATTEDESAARERLERKLRQARRTARFGYPAFRALAATWRTSWPGIEHFQFDDPHATPSILTVWHQVLLPGSYIGRNRGFGVMISQHGDGEIIAKVMQRLGFEAIRGSSTRGGARALITMLRVPPETRLVMTPDGPRGPARRAQDGVLMLAERSGRIILPTGLAASRAWHAKSWDRLIVPKPFAKVVLYTLPGFQIPKNTMKDDRERERWRTIVEQKLDEAQRCAEDAVAGIDRSASEAARAKP